jgi:hypothetical protein
VIVDESVKQHQAQAALIESLRNDLEKVLADHQQLLTEFNAFRECLNIPSTSVQASTAIASPQILSGYEQSMETNKVPVLHATNETMYCQGQTSHDVDGGSSSILTAPAFLDGQPFQYRAFEPQVVSSTDQPFNNSNACMGVMNVSDASHAFEILTVTDASQSNNLVPGLEIEISPGPEVLDAFAFPTYADGYWDHNPQTSTCTNYSAGFGGAPPSMIISNG